jgi:hypothetical protein
VTFQEFHRLHDGGHVELQCEVHPEKRWSCKKIALSPDKNGVLRYNHSRHLFYNLHSVEGMGPECDCPAKNLRAMVEDKF